MIAVAVLVSESDGAADDSDNDIAGPIDVPLIDADDLLEVARLTVVRDLTCTICSVIAYSALRNAAS